MYQAFSPFGGIRRFDMSWDAQNQKHKVQPLFEQFAKVWLDLALAGVLFRGVRCSRGRPACHGSDEWAPY